MWQGARTTGGVRGNGCLICFLKLHLLPLLRLFSKLLYEGSNQKGTGISFSKISKLWTGIYKEGDYLWEIKVSSS